MTSSNDLDARTARRNAAITDLIRDDLIAHNTLTDRTNNEFATFNINYDIMRIASAELTAALAIPADPSFRYYYSDSTHDEIRNPATIIDECRAFFDDDYDDADLLPHASTLTDNLDYLLFDYFDDADLTFASITELAAHIAAAVS